MARQGGLNHSSKHVHGVRIFLEACCERLVRLRSLALAEISHCANAIRLALSAGEALAGNSLSFKALSNLPSCSSASASGLATTAASAPSACACKSCDSALSGSDMLR